MIPYFLTYIICVLFALSNNKKVQKSSLLWFITFLYFVFFIGFRHQVGGDWFSYISHFEGIGYYDTLTEVLIESDPGYYGLNWIVYTLGLEIYTVNFICAFLFMYGFSYFIKNENNKWLLLVVALPYTIYVVAMGYTRQAVALGFIFVAIVHLREKRLFKFILYVLFATLFHKTAIVMMGLGLFIGGRNKIVKILALVVIGIGGFQMFLSQQVDALWTNYVDAQMQSQGAKIRTFMNLIPSVLLLIYRKRWKKYFNDFQFWFIISFLSIVSFLLVGYASTAVDRLALYCLPIQMIVFGRLHILLEGRVSQLATTVLISFYYFLVLFVWLFFATHAHAWIPYQNLLFLELYNAF